MVINPSDGNYDNVDLWVKPDLPVAAIGQIGNLSDVSFEDKFAFREELTVDDVTDKIRLPNMVFVATDAGYKVHCPHIPPTIASGSYWPS